MCEGPNELEIIRILLSYDMLIFGEDELIGLTPFHARQIVSNSQVRTELNLYPENDVLIMRVGDKQSDILKIPADYRHKIIGIEKYCTKPELEMLLIIAEGLLPKYEKTKSTVSPKDFAKANIKIGKKHYDNSSLFYRMYFGSTPEKLVEALIEYKQLRGSHKKDERYLADLLK